MLKSLRIENFVLIESCELNFEKGFTSITGETGSGKSILLNAISLLLGERADFSVIGPKSNKAYVEAEFLITDHQIAVIFSNNELEYFDQLIIRREISDQGRSRAFINDTPVQLNLLKEIAERLISIHSQYNTLELKDPDYQLELLDLLVSAHPLKMEYRKIFEQWQENRRELNNLRTKIDQLQKEQDYNAFQLSELEALQLETTSFDELDIEIKRAEHSQAIIGALALVTDLLGGEEQILDRLINATSRLGKVENIDPSLGEFTQRLNSIKLETDDLNNALHSYMENVELNPEKLQGSIARLDQFNSLLRKHKKSSQDDLIKLKIELEEKTQKVNSAGDEIERLTKSVEDTFVKMKKSADLLHQLRIDGASKIESELSETLRALKLAETQLKFDISATETYTNNGHSMLQMLFSANKGMAPVAIEKAASGGELSRLMLALQKMVSEKKTMPTVFFDEIDTGVSGDVAQKIGSLLKSMGRNFQLFAITHLPQVAAKAESQLLVEKSSSSEQTKTTITYLSQEERITEIARLMSGDKINDAARTHALELMSHE